MRQQANVDHRMSRRTTLYTIIGWNDWLHAGRARSNNGKRQILGLYIRFVGLGQLRPCLVRKNFQDSLSHRIFSRMYGALNIDENKN